MMSGVAYPLREGKPIVMTGQVNIVITPSPRVTSCNRWADKIVILEHGVLGHNMLQRSFIFAPAEVQGDHYQLGPKALCWYLQQRDTAALAPVHKETFGPTYDACQPGRGVPVEWFNSHQLRHILLHRVGMITTMAELATRTAYREVIVPGLCCFCRQPDTVRHAWDRLPSTHIVRHLLKGLCAWIQKTRYMDRQVERHIEKEMGGASYLVVWYMATTTEGFRQDNLSVATQDSMGVQFLKQLLDASMKLHRYRYEHCENYFRVQHLGLRAIKQWLHDHWENKNRGNKGGGEEEVEEPEGAKTAGIWTKPTGPWTKMRRTGTAASKTPCRPARRTHSWTRISTGARRPMFGLLHKSEPWPAILQLHRRQTLPGPSPRGP